MANKIEGAIKKMLGKNEKTAEKLKKKKNVLIEGPGKAMGDSVITDEQAFENEMKRRKSFGALGGANKAKTMPRKPAPKKPKGK